MSEIKALFWDVGGVLLSNGWDHHQRRAATEHFGLDGAEFQRRHEEVVAAFETGHATLDAYLEHTVFHRPRPFTHQAFTEFMFGRSQARPEALALCAGLAGRYRMATINNESRELNLHRIERFGLHDLFGFFVSSCFVGLSKPDARIFRLALDLIQLPAEACCFIDDRPGNLEPARALGMHTIEGHDPGHVRDALARLGVEAPPPSR